MADSPAPRPRADASSPAANRAGGSLAELDPQPLGVREVLLHDRDPEVADAAEVVEDELVERDSVLPVDRRKVLPGGVPFRSGHRRNAQGCDPAPTGGGYRLSRIEDMYFGAGAPGRSRNLRNIGKPALQAGLSERARQDSNL